MASRRKDTDGIELIVKLGGLVFLVVLMSPQARQVLSMAGMIILVVLGLAIIGGIGYWIYRTDDSEQTATIQHKICRNTAVETANNSVHADANFSEQLHSIDWFQFEKLVALVYRNLGYAVVRRGGANPDGGIDLLIEKDGQQWAVQCKQWKTRNVGIKPVREFLGALTDAGIKQGIFITLAGYTGDARKLAEKHSIEIVNETSLARMLESSNARFDPEAQALLSDTRKFCPKCESEMVLRTTRKGNNVGSQFWGCSTYPRCRHTLSVS